MANTYPFVVTASQSTTNQVRILQCDVSVQINPTDVLTLVYANACGILVNIEGFTNVAAGSAADTTSGSNAGNTAPSQTNGALTTATSGDLVVGAFVASNSPTVTNQFDNSAGNTMTQVHTPEAGQSRTGWAQFLVESVAATYNPRATLSASQAWAAVAARWNASGGAATPISGSAATTGWNVVSAGGSLTISPGATIPVGAKLLIFSYSTANSGSPAITDNAGSALTQTLTAASTAAATGTTKQVNITLKP